MLADTPDASDLVHPCRPTVSCTADIIAPGSLEVEAGALYSQADLWPSLALSAQIALPTFQEQGYVRHDDVFVTAFASKDVGAFHFDWNVGALFWGVEGSPAAQAFTALALSPSLPKPFGAALEGYYFSNAAPLAPRDAGIRAAGTVAARAFSLFTGVTLIPVVFWRQDTRAR